MDVIHEYNKGTELLAQGKWKKAMSIFKACFKLYKCRELAVNLGNCFRANGQELEAYKMYQFAAKEDTPALDPTTIKHAYNNLGLAEYTLGNTDLAIEYYTKAIKLDPKFWDAWWNCSTAVLRKASTNGTSADFAKGWEMYNARFLKAAPVALKNKKENLLFWTPRTKVGSIIVLTEQGIGDAIMFGRYIEYLRDYADKVYVQCAPYLYPIFNSIEGVECTDDAINVDVEYAYPICSLAQCFDFIPSSEWLHFTNKREFDDKTRPNIGIVFSGSNTHTNNRYRSVDVARFHRLAKYANLYCLTPGFKSNKFIKSLPINSWIDTAEYINGLDLIISVDTSVVHLAGSMGKETWVLQPMQETDFRWGEGVEKCLWYNSVRIFENPRDWTVTFDKVEATLVKWIEERNANNIS
jgi:tetratricopeptide (TPR) repeat protein